LSIAAPEMAKYCSNGKWPSTVAMKNAEYCSIKKMTELLLQEEWMSTVAAKND
jgi:hypothetical protein